MASDSGRNSARSWLTVLNQQESVLILAFVLVIVGVTVLNQGFIAPTNLVDILYNSSYIGVAAIGMTMVIICGHIDISIGAALGLCATVAGKLAVAGVPLGIVFAATIVAGGVIGLVNGLLVAYCRIPAIVTTLGMASILKGGLILTTGGIWIYGLPPGFGISRQLILSVPVPICALIVLGIAFSLWLKYSAAGREIYAVGGNAEAARLSGLPVRRVTLGVFVLNGLLVGISAILYATNFTAIQSNVAPGFELTVITSAVIGGVSILGGTGTVVGALLGAILLQTIGTALVFLHIRAEWFQTVQGSLILLTILLDVYRRSKTSGAGAALAGGGGGDASSPKFLNWRWLTVQEAVLVGILILVVVVLSFRSDRFLTRGEFAEPNSLFVRGCASHCADDVHHHSRRNRSLGRFDDGSKRSFVGIFLAKLRLSALGGCLRSSLRRYSCGPPQRAGYCLPWRAAFNCHSCDAGNLSWTIIRHKRIAIGERFS